MKQEELNPILDNWIDDNTVDGDFIAHPDFVYDKLLELQQQVSDLIEENEKLKAYVLYQAPICKDAPVPLSEYCDLSHVCDECKKRKKVQLFLKELSNERD